MNKVLGVREIIIIITNRNNQRSFLASSTLLCATVFLEDAVNYQSIIHKVTRVYLSIHRWFSCSLIRK